MNPRSVSILEAAVQEFIDTGEPVSSGWLYRKYDFGIKPAMIRLELDALEDSGYLEQPHHAAGRVPTDLGYEFFAARALEADLRKEMRNAFTNLFAQHSWADLLAEMSSELGLLGVAVDSMNDEVYKSGLEALVNNLNWEDREGIRSVIHDFESVGDRLPRAAAIMGDPSSPSGQVTLRVFIGRKSPVTSSDNLSVIGGNYKVGDATVSIFAIGPKRMDYRKTIRIFRSL
jgi:transcriptional regulator of heat shock response